MYTKKQMPIININEPRSTLIKKTFVSILALLAGYTIIPIEPARSEVIHLKCTGKFEINRGELIKPDWETSNLSINLNGLKSTIEDKGIKKVGSTFIRRNYYTITHRGSDNKITTKYKINAIYGTYQVEYKKINRTLIGTCQKGKG